MPPAGRSREGLPAAGLIAKGPTFRPVRTTPPHSPIPLPAHSHGPPGPPPVLHGFHRLRVALRSSTDAAIDDVCLSAVYDIARVKGDTAWSIVRYVPPPAEHHRRKPGDPDSHSPQTAPGKPLSGLALLQHYLKRFGVACPQGDLDSVCDAASNALAEWLSHASRRRLGLGSIVESRP